MRTGYMTYTQALHLTVHLVYDFNDYRMKTVEHLSGLTPRLTLYTAHVTYTLK